MEAFSFLFSSPFLLIVLVKKIVQSILENNLTYYVVYVMSLCVGLVGYRTRRYYE